jgi:hypothetical protein
VAADPASATPGTSRTRCSTASDQAYTSSIFRKSNALPGRTAITSRPSGVYPGFTAPSRAKLCTSQPDPAVSTIAKAISATMSADMVREVP